MARRHYACTPPDALPTSRGRLTQEPARHLAEGTWPLRAIRATRVELGGERSAPRAARDAVDAHLGGALTEAELHDLCLLVSELVNNAVLHGRREAGVVLYLALSPERVRVEVCDGGPGFDAAVTHDDPAGEGGFGLSLVDTIAARWGVAAEGGTCVWFEVDR